MIDALIRRFWRASSHDASPDDIRLSPTIRANRRAAAQEALAAILFIIAAFALFWLIYAGHDEQRTEMEPDTHEAATRYIANFRLDAGQSGEATSVVHKGDALKYSWSTDGSRLSFKFLDSNSRPFGPGQGDFTTLDVTFRVGASGTYRWVWQNRTNAPVMVTFEAANGFSGLNKYRAKGPQ